MIDSSLIRELETPVELDKNIVKKQGFKTLLGIVLGTTIAGTFIWYMQKDDLEKAEQHKNKLEVEYVDETGNKISKHLVESENGTHILDIDKAAYVDHKTKSKTNTKDRAVRKSKTNSRDRTDTNDRRSRDNGSRRRKRYSHK